MSFKVGERVRAFAAMDSDKILGAGQGIYYEGAVGRIEGDLIQLQKGSSWYHAKQCRKLVKKPRRRVWIFMPHFDTYSNQNPAHAYMKCPDANKIAAEDWQEFIEVRKAKKG